jgi:hypothetical protein
LLHEKVVLRIMKDGVSNSAYGNLFFSIVADHKRDLRQRILGLELVDVVFDGNFSLGDSNLARGNFYV